jgi:hypothetical protein
MDDLLVTLPAGVNFIVSKFYLQRKKYFFVLEEVLNQSCHVNFVSWFVIIKSIKFELQIPFLKFFENFSVFEKSELLVDLN